MASQWLQAIKAKDLQLWIAGRDFAATQTMDEEYRQEIEYGGAFGSEGPVWRHVRKANEDSVSFTVRILKTGASKGMIDETYVKDTLSPDFAMVLIRGARRVALFGCNWNRIAVNSTLDASTLTMDVSIPGYEPVTK
jgi:hypothetical protein